jgi:hypothetical protein
LDVLDVLGRFAAEGPTMSAYRHGSRVTLADANRAALDALSFAHWARAMAGADDVSTDEILKALVTAGRLARDARQLLRLAEAA